MLDFSVLFNSNSLQSGLQYASKNQSSDKERAPKAQVKAHVSDNDEITVTVTYGNKTITGTIRDFGKGSIVLYTEEGQIYELSADKKRVTRVIKDGKKISIISEEKTAIKESKTNSAEADLEVAGSSTQTVSTASFLSLTTAKRRFVEQ